MKESIQMTFQSYTSLMFWGSLKSYLTTFQVVPSKYMCSIGKENTTSHFWSYSIQLLNSIQFIFHLFTILLIIIGEDSDFLCYIISSFWTVWGYRRVDCRKYSKQKYFLWGETEKCITSLFRGKNKKSEKKKKGGHFTERSSMSSFWFWNLERLGLFYQLTFCLGQVFFGQALSDPTIKYVLN